MAVCQALACDCDDFYPFDEQFENSEKIFSGTVVEITDSREEFWPPWMKNTFIKVTIHVDRYWKGNVREKETIKWNSYCRYYLKNGDKMLLFANSGFPYDLAGCGLSDRIANSQETLKKLGAGSTDFSRDFRILYKLIFFSGLIFSMLFCVKLIKWNIVFNNAAYELAKEIRTGKWDHLGFIESGTASEYDEIIHELKKRCPGHTIGAYKKAISIGLKMIEVDKT